jgi:hypothetical protein
MAALEQVAGSTFVICDPIVAEVLAGTRNRKEYAVTKQELFAQFHVLP